jgi:Skp family chaperone for outer membrane proteins
MKPITILLLLTLGLSATAQDGRKEKIEALKVGFITKELNLTTDEAQKFWPVFNQYEDELHKLRESRKSDLENLRDNFDKMSDADISKAIDNEINFQQQELDLRKKYVGEFRKVLPVKKVARLLKAEQQFKLKLLQEYRERPGGPGGPDGPPPGGKPMHRD